MKTTKELTPKTYAKIKTFEGTRTIYLIERFICHNEPYWWVRFADGGVYDVLESEIMKGN